MFKIWNQDILSATIHFIFSSLQLDGWTTYQQSPEAIKGKSTPSEGGVPLLNQNSGDLLNGTNCLETNRQSGVISSKNHE
jgi:hypothetical protein